MSELTTFRVAEPGLDARQRPGYAYLRLRDSAELSRESVDQALARVAYERGQQPALVWFEPSGPMSMTWKELYRRACTAASAFLELNPNRARTALIAPNSVDWIVAMYGCAIAGMAVVPISPSASDPEVAHMLSQSRVGLVLAARSVGDRPVLQRICDIAAQLNPSPVVRDIAGRSELSPTVLEPVANADKCSDEFLVQHTSGTTGLPKAAVLSHRAAFNVAKLHADAIGLRAGETYLNPLPLFHVGGSITGLLEALAIAGTFVVIERFNSAIALRAVREFSPAVIGTVPTMLIDLLALPGVSPSDFSSVRTVMGGATAVDPALIDEIENKLGLRFIVSYGQSEAPGMTTCVPADPIELRMQTIGHCLPGRDYYICDRDGSVLHTGSIGELCVRGPLIMSGYLKENGSIDPSVDSEGWLRTGDLCSMDDRGVVTFQGRVREVIIRGGENVYPAEVEHVLTTHPSVVQAAVFGVSDHRLGERVVAAVLPHTDAKIDADDLSAFAAERLSRYKRPVEWVIATVLPRTSTGKVRKHLLQQWYEAGTIAVNCEVLGFM